MAIEPVARILDRAARESAFGPAPAQGGAAERASNRPQPEIAHVDSGDAREDAARQADLSALNEQAGGDAGRVLGDKGSEHDDEPRQHGDSSSFSTGRRGISDSYSSAMPRSPTSTAVRLTVAASSRSISTLTSRRSAH